MYRYDEFDHKLVAERARQFRRQVKRRLSGELTEDQFKPLRLMNGLYMQHGTPSRRAGLLTTPASGTVETAPCR